MLSVIIPIYNAEKYLDKCISSIVNQTYRDIEILLLNDGSTDESLEICKKYAQKDSRIKVVDKINEGLVKTRKYGIQIASGEYITFVDSDDWIDANAYERVLKNGFEADAIVYGMVEEFGYKSVEVRSKISAGFYDRYQIEELIAPQVLYGKIFFEFGLIPNLVCKVIKSDIIKKCADRISDIVTIGEDVDFSCSVFSEISSISIVDFSPYHYIQRKDSMMRTETPLENLMALYEDLKKSAIRNRDKLMWNKQVCAYMEFVMLLKAPHYLFNKLEQFKIIKNKKIAIYGAGDFGKQLCTAIKKNGYADVAMLIDKNWEVIKCEGVPVIGIDNINDFSYDYIFIAILNENICESVKKSLIQYNIESSKILYFNASDVELKDMDRVLAGE